MTRPATHLAPESGFLNDPTGMVRLDGRWHVFFQHSPGPVHGDVGWGHAVSDDLLAWELLPPAIAPDAEEVVYTGSVVLDADDTAGFGRGALVAAYTSHSRTLPLERQALAASVDGGMTWTKHGVVLDIGSADFRDPRLLRYGDRWLMVVALAADATVAVYSSSDLRAWQHESNVSLPPQGVWECPDLVPLDGRWVLLVSHADATHYLVGDFDGRTFTPDGGGLRRLDHGPDLYAAVTFAGTPEDRRVLLGWMDSWVYAQVLPTTPWRGRLSAARELSLADAGGTAYLRQRPLAPTRTVTVDAPVTLAPGVRASYDGGAVLLERLPELVPGYAGRWRLPSPDGRLDLVEDAGSLEVFTSEGRSATLLALDDGGRPLPE